MIWVGVVEMSRWIVNIIKSFILIFGLTVVTSTFSGVVLTGTRVIFADGQNEKTIYLQNKDHYPNLVQIWLDDGDENSTLENSQAPFIISPQIFRINSNTGQTVRLLFTGEQKISQNTESLFYMNFSEFPAVKKQDADASRLMIVFKNRVKVFYRPKNLKGSVTDVYKELQFSLKNNEKSKQLVIQNPAAYYANIKELSLISEDGEFVVNKNELIAPHAQVAWEINNNINMLKDFKIKLTLVNDYGALVVHEITLNK